MQVIVVLF